ncbi:MAG: hypothetical protein JRG75_01765 [Deltaproteobacteria bacterium]|nr:hypothetical protein [Deltaproteobacteria bacterium]
MKISKGFLLSLVGFFILSLAACGSGKYSDVNEAMIAQAEAMENYIDAMGKAESAEDVVAAIEGFTREMKKLLPEMQNMLAKYPELAELEAPPEELREQTEKMRELSGNLQASMMKSMQYMQDPEVQKAMEKQGKVMMETAKE